MYTVGRNVRLAYRGTGQIVTVWGSGTGLSMAEATKKKSLKGPMVILGVVLGIPVIGLLGWYAYTVVFELNKPQMTKFEKELAVKAKKLAKKAAALADRAIREGFAVEKVGSCHKVTDQYITPQGWILTDAKLHQLVGLPARATKQQMEERCIAFAKAVAEMEKLSHHTRHVFVCPGAYFEVAGSQKYRIVPDPNGRGIVQNITNNRDRLQAIKPGKSVLINQWQVYNIGDGCIIVGLSKAGTFRFSGRASNQ